MIGKKEFRRGERVVRIAKVAVWVAAVPVILLAHKAGPDVHRTGVPGTGEKTCADVGCHVGTPLNGGGGSLTISAAEGTTYTPGQTQTITITVQDSKARLYGFQMTARLSNDRNQQAGTFTPGDAQSVQCAPVEIHDNPGLDRPADGCPADQPLEFAQHTSPFRSNVIKVDWTPPAKASGAIEIWVSANAANGNGDETGDHIYNTSLTLAAPCIAGATPAISRGGVITAGGFGGKAGVTSGTWLEIYGTNLASTSREWGSGDFSGSAAPTSLECVGVTVAGKNAFVRFVSPGQVNVQAPDGIGTGPVPIVVTNAGVSSAPVNLTATTTLPGLLAPFGNGYLAAFTGSDLVGSPGFAAVKPGAAITLYGIGFGPVSPAISAGNITDKSNAVANPCTLTIGGVNATVAYKGLSPNFVGLYQFNVTVPNVPDGDQPVTVDLGGTGTGQKLNITVKK